jgi:hypothetical protein
LPHRSAVASCSLLRNGVLSRRCRRRGSARHPHLVENFIQGRHGAAPPRLILNQPGDALDIDASTPWIFMPHNQLVLADPVTAGQKHDWRRGVRHEDGTVGDRGRHVRRHLQAERSRGSSATHHALGSAGLRTGFRSTSPDRGPCGPTSSGRAVPRSPRADPAATVLMWLMFRAVARGGVAATITAWV